MVSSTALSPRTQTELIHTVKWNLLVILDACRADYFQRVNTIPGNFRKVMSAGSCATEWGSGTFTESYPDIVYISTVPLNTACFGLVRDLWMDKFDEKQQTVLPAEVVSAALEIKQQTPSRRIIAHFLQPHPPMISYPPFGLDDWNRITHQHTDILPSLEEVWKKGYGNWLKKAYEANLKLALWHVKKLTTGWVGKAVITADHGESFGEEGVYGHPQGSSVRALREVPWLELDNL